MDNTSYPEHVHLQYKSKRLFSVKSLSAIHSPKLGSRPVDPSWNARPELEFDFRDVFGGPPRTAATKEPLQWMLEATNRSHPPERPVFGDESPARRRLLSEDFFNDIYGGESPSSSKGKTEKVSFFSMPVSRALSPNLPSSPKMPQVVSTAPNVAGIDESVTDSAKLAPRPQIIDLCKPSESTSLRSPRYGHPKKHETHSPVFSISSTKEQSCGHGINSRTLTTYVQEPQLLTNGSLSSVQQSSFVSNEPLQSSKEFVVGKPQGNAMMDKPLASHASPNLHNNGEFHFSIHKWAGKGATLFFPPKPRIGSSKEQNFREEKSGKPQSEIGTIPPTTNHKHSSLGIDIPYDQNLKTKGNPQHQEKTTQADTCIATDANNSKTVDLPIICVHFKEDFEFQVSEVSNLSKDGQEVSGKDASIDLKTDAVQKSVRSVRLSSDQNINYSLRVRLEDLEASRPTENASELNSKESLDGNRLKGKVKEFIKIFNQEASQNSTPKIISQSKSQKGLASSGAEAQQNACNVETRPIKITKGLTNVTQTRNPIKLPYQQVVGLEFSPTEAHLRNATLETSEEAATEVCGEGAFAPMKICDILAQEEDDNFDLQFTVHEIHSTIPERNISGTHTLESSKLVDDLKGRSVDGNHQGTCKGEALSADKKFETFSSQPQDDLQSVERKIKKWANGKQGNIRSLLSTLQYILWPESGWKPVPLVDIIEGNAVKRSYQKALLCLHPDKIQQKCGTPHQKYLAEKVFDILQEAWTDFNNVGSF